MTVNIRECEGRGKYGKSECGRGESFEMRVKEGIIFLHFLHTVYG